MNHEESIRKLETYQDIIKRELMVGLCFNSGHESVLKIQRDILIVVHDQYEYIKQCVESVQANTKNHHIYIWDNASKPQTADYLQSLKQFSNITVVRSEENLGFIIPNNRLAAMGSGNYLILLNSDTVVKSGWDDSMIGWLMEHPHLGVVGYSGGILDEKYHGTRNANGSDVDYICGWCLCVSRNTYTRFGLFDEGNLKFAYGEDSDLSFRLREAGLGIYALHLELVHHYGNVTVTAVAKEGCDMAASFHGNHKYIEQRWGKIIKEWHCKS
jgi:GT2 family glycosyltransferase